MNKVPIFPIFCAKFLFFPIFWHREFLFSYFFDHSYYLMPWKDEYCKLGKEVAGNSLHLNSGQTYG